MGPEKSQGQLMLDLYGKLFTDLSNHFPDQSRHFTADYRVLQRRYRNEGISFFTKTLPSFRKAVDKGMDSGVLESPLGFERSHTSPGVPAFLQGLVTLCFDDSGHLVEQPDPAAFAAIRQVCDLGYKLELPYDEPAKAAVISSFVANEKFLSNFSLDTEDETLQCAQAIVQEVRRDFDFRDILPRHGPGAVATGERSEEKWTFARLYSNIHQVYPYYDYYVVGREHLRDSVERYMGWARLKAGCAKVVLVPKDSRGPRLISCEPLEYQWIQQGQARAFMCHLEYHRMTCGHVNFTSQKVNQRLARDSSRTREMATLDMKDASDLVSQELVQYLFQEDYRYLAATRSESTLLPDGTILPLRKFAPMGSAMCFPVESLCFWAISVAAIVQHTGWSVDQVKRRVYVYGDDLIVPTEYAYLVMSKLTTVGLRVNIDKSLVEGYFRESCGVDAYKGVDVTPTRLKTLWSGKPGDGKALAAWVQYGNAFQRCGYQELATYIFSMVEATYGKLPYGTVKSGYFCREVNSVELAVALNRQDGWEIRVCPDTHQGMIRSMYLKVRRTATSLDGWERMFRNFTKPERDPDSVVVANTTQIKSRWNVIR